MGGFFYYFARVIRARENDADQKIRMVWRLNWALREFFHQMGKSDCSVPRRTKGTIVKPIHSLSRLTPLLGLLRASGLPWGGLATFFIAGAGCVSSRRLLPRQSFTFLDNRGAEVGKTNFACPLVLKPFSDVLLVLILRICTVLLDPLFAPHFFFADFIGVG